MRIGLRVEPLLRLGRQLVAQRLEVGDERGAVVGPAGRIADRVDVQLEGADPERAVPRRLHRDHLGIDGGIVRPDRLDPELPVLAVATCLRRARTGTSARSTRA